MDERDNNFPLLARVFNVVLWVIVLTVAVAITYLVWQRIF